MNKCCMTNMSRTLMSVVEMSWPIVAYLVMKQIERSMPCLKLIKIQ